MDTQPATTETNRPPLPENSASFDFEREIAELHQTPEWTNGGARKVLLAFNDFGVVLRTMKANTTIANHYNPGRICVQTLRGHIRMRADGRLYDLPVGKMLVLDRAVPHDVEAIEESAFLLTVVQPKPIGEQRAAS